MELEDLKNNWEDYNKKLSENLKLNEAIFRKFNLDKSQREMNTPKSFELINIIVGIIFILIGIKYSFVLAYDIKFLSFYNIEKYN